MLTPRPRHSSAALAVSSVLALALALLVVACEAPQPTVPPLSGPQTTAQRDPTRPPGVDHRVAISRMSMAPTAEGSRDSILLEVKAGPSYLINRIPVPVPELRTFVAELYGPRPRKVLFIRADAEVSEMELERAVEAARRGMRDAIDIAERHGFFGELAEIKMIASSLR